MRCFYCGTELVPWKQFNSVNEDYREDEPWKQLLCIDRRVLKETGLEIECCQSCVSRKDTRTQRADFISTFLHHTATLS